MRLTEAEAAELLKKTKCRISGAVKPSGRVVSRKIRFDGLEFASKTEMGVYREYKLDPCVEILETQPEFVLQEGFRRNGKKHRPIKYTADFRIREGGKEIIVEVKSQGTLKANIKSYPIRKKLFLKKFPELIFREIIVDGKSRDIRDF